MFSFVGIIKFHSISRASYCKTL